MRAVQVVVALLLCALNAPGGMVRAGDAAANLEREVPTVDQVFAMWAEREARCQRFQATWIHERTYTKFWQNCHVPDAREEYVTLRFGESRLLLDGDRLRFDSGEVDASGDVVLRAGPPEVDQFGRVAGNDYRRVFQDSRNRYDGGRPSVDPRDAPPTAWPRNLRAFTTAYDGRRNVQFLPAERGDYPEAYVFAGSENRFVSSGHYLPLLMAVRPSWLGLSPANCRMRATLEPLRGRTCCVLETTSGLRREYWLDLDRELLVAGFREECDILGARMKNRIEVDYAEGAEGDWWPSGWTAVYFDDHGLLEQSAAATVVSADAKPAANVELFAVTLPPETWVYDEATQRHWLVDQDGRERNVTASELAEGLTHAELVGRGLWSGRFRVAAQRVGESLWGQFSLIALVAVGLVYWLRGRRAAQASTGEEVSASRGSSGDAGARVPERVRSPGNSGT